MKIKKKINDILPSFISFNNFRYIETENNFYNGFYVSNYNETYKSLIFEKLINSPIEGSINIYIDKKNKTEIIKQVTSYINLVDSSSNKSAQDFELINSNINNLKDIRRKLQTKSQEYYSIFVYIINKNKKLNNVIKNKDIIKSIGIYSNLHLKSLDFRYKELLLSSLPFCKNSKKLMKISENNLLSDGIKAIYPFFLDSIYDKNGIFLGTNKNTGDLVIIDRFNRDKYKNGNMCIFGSSGSGKSFFTKLQIIRERIIGRKQFVIDPEREYKNIGEFLDGTYIKLGKNSNSYINIFEIRDIDFQKITQKEMEEEITNKIEKLKSFFYMIFENIKKEEYALFESILKEIYIEKLIKEKKEMPLFIDVYNKLKENKQINKYSILLEKFIYGNLSFFNNQTNINIDNKLVIADIYDLGEEDIKYGIFLFIDRFWDEIRKNREDEKILYIDEIWKLIGVSAKKETALYIYKIFKTIRKYGGCAVAITQDIKDVFSLENGNFGSTILNNSTFNIIFSLNDENIKNLNEFIYLTEKEKVFIRGNSKGEAFLKIDNNNLLLNVNTSEFEKNLIEGDKNDKKDINVI